MPRSIWTGKKVGLGKKFNFFAARTFYLTPNHYLEEDISKYGTNNTVYSAAIHGEEKLAEAFMLKNIQYENTTPNAEQIFIFSVKDVWQRDWRCIQRWGKYSWKTANPLLNSASYKCYTAIVKISGNPWMWGISMIVKNVTKKRIPLRIRMNLSGSFRGGNPVQDIYRESNKYNIWNRHPGHHWEKEY